MILTKENINLFRVKKNFAYGLFLFLVVSAGLYGQETIDSAALNSKKAALAELKSQSDKYAKQITDLEKEIAQISTPKEYWKFGMFTTATLSQAQYVNWAPGGESNVTFILTGDVFANYVNTPAKVSWTNKFNGLLGYRTADDFLQKTNDIINLQSNFAYNLFPKLAVAADFSLRTQFLSTQDYAKESKPTISSFFAPAYINVGVGVKWSPNSWFKGYFSPLTAQITTVLHDAVDPVAFGLKGGERAKVEVGWYANLEVNKALAKNINFGATCYLFNNYLSELGNRAIDVDLRLKLDAKIAKYFYATLFVNLKYDADAKLKLTDAIADGTPATYRDAGLQIFENVGIGFSYTIQDRFL